MAVTTTAPTQIGSLLRDWRRQRRMSQLELALDAGISTRHLSFVETGRSRPSAAVVLRLAERLAVPLRERNQLLIAAGFAPRYGELSLDDQALAPVRGAIELLLTEHEPHPAMVADRHWNLIAGNRGIGLLTAGAAPELLEPPANWMRLALHPDGIAPRIVNLVEWRARLLERLARQVSLTGDAGVAALLRELEDYPGRPSASPAPEPDADTDTDARAHASTHAATIAGSAADPSGIVVPLRLRDPDGGELRFLSTVATFGTALDVTVAELSIESFFPADEETATAARAWAERAAAAAAAD